jgi:AcrR family transcriptional regulator
VLRSFLIGTLSRINGAMTTKIVKTPKRGRGRPSAFHRDTALGEAMKLFWQRGYEGTTFDELIAAMGISPTSFYKAFESKEELYRWATETSLDVSGGWFERILGDERLDPREAFEQLFLTTAEDFTSVVHKDFKASLDWSNRRRCTFFPDGGRRQFNWRRLLYALLITRSFRFKPLY